jgi:phosphate transport system permease protein
LETIRAFAGGFAPRSSCCHWSRGRLWRCWRSAEHADASYALGVSKWQTVIRVVLPTSFGGILTGTTLAIARAAGETAPLLFTCAIAGNLVDWNPTHSMQSIPLTIFEYSESPDPILNEQAWAAAFVLIAFVLVTSLTARLLLDRSKRKLGTTQ